MVGTPHTPYEMGYYAYQFGHDLDSNPFQEDTLDYDRWETGWLACEAEEDLFLGYGTLDWI